MKIIIVTGTPGTGKTTLAKKLSKKLGFLYIDVNRLICKNKLHEGYDKKRRTKIVDTGKLGKFLVKEIKSEKYGRIRGIVMDSHLSHCIPSRYVDFCIVAKCGISELSRRLKRKKFHKSKIRENLQAEIFDVCYNEAAEGSHNVIAVDTSKGFNTGKIAGLLGG